MSSAATDRHVWTARRRRDLLGLRNLNFVHAERALACDAGTLLPMACCWRRPAYGRSRRLNSVGFLEARPIDLSQRKRRGLHEVLKRFPILVFP